MINERALPKPAELFVRLAKAQSEQPDRAEI